MDRLNGHRMFVAVVETGSFAAASARLGTSSGQASKLVSQLEAELGVQLLNRTTRALSLTEAGRGYFGGLKNLLDDFDALDAAVRQVSGAVSGRLKISAPISFGTARLTPVLLDFARLHPDIQLDVAFSDRLVNLVDEGFDASIRIGKPEDSGLIARRLCDARVILAAAPAYLDRRGIPARPEDLTAHDCIIDTNFRDPDHWRFSDGRSGEMVMPISGRLRFSNADACLQAVAAGAGISRLPSFIAGPYLAQGTLRPVLADREPPPLAIHAVYPSSRHLARKVRALVDFLADAFKGQPEWDRDWLD